MWAHIQNEFLRHVISQRGEDDTYYLRKTET